MNIKRWFAWVCLALMLFSEFLLLRAYKERDTAQTDCREAQQHLRQAQTELDELKQSASGQLNAENSRLRKQYEILNSKLTAANTLIAQLQEANASASNNLENIQEALQQQQEHIARVNAEKLQLAAAGAAIIAKNTCINHLREIDAAKQQWALEKGKPDNAVPKVQDLLPYLKDGVFPTCPGGGTHTINAVAENPDCSIPGHAIPQ